MSKHIKIEKYINTIKSSALFANIPMDYMEEMLISLQGVIKHYKKNEIILNAGDAFRFCMVVLEGTVEVSYDTYNYEKIKVNHFCEGDILGEALSLKGTLDSPIQISSLTNTTVLCFNLHNLIVSTERCSKSCRYNHQLLLNLMNIMAEQNIFSNLKLRILAQKSIRDRLLVYLMHMHANQEKGTVIPFSQTALAEFLGVNRSALSRELGKMQDEGIIRVKGKKYWLFSY